MSNSKLGLTLRKGFKLLLLTLVIGLIFFIKYFPVEDLSDLVSSKVSEMTDNKVFLEFGEFNYSLAPPGLEFKNVSLETDFTPGLQAKEISITPSVSALIAKKPSGSVHAKGVLDGDISISTKKGPPTETGKETQAIELEVEKASLNALRELMKWNLVLAGNLSLSADGQIEPGLSEQPDISFDIAIDNFSHGPVAFNLPGWGQFPISGMKLGLLHFKGRLSNGKINIETGEIGQKNDDLFGKIKGFINFSIAMQGGQIFPQLGAYEFDLDVTASKSFAEKPNNITGLLKVIQPMSEDSDSGKNSLRYHFKVSGPMVGAPPNITATR